MSEADAAGRRRGAGPLIEWLIRRDLLRGPFLFVDYWTSVLGLRGRLRRTHVESGWVDPALFRLGLDRPDLEVPRLRFYFFLFLMGPLVLPFRAFRRLGRYTLRLHRRVGQEVLASLHDYRLRLESTGPGRVTVRRGDTVLGRDLLDPRVIAGFSSLFLATYKLPMASLTAILAMAVLTPLLHALGSLDVLARYWIPVGFPLLVAILYFVFRDGVTALLGAVPVLVGRYLFTLLDPARAWTPFLLSLAGLYLLFLLADWFFMPRPVPPVLLFYDRTGPASPYEREGDEPYWLEGTAYWVWRYLMLAPAELNKFWEKDWERVEIWIRADGEEAGALEWVVTDAHYRELWTPCERLDRPQRLARHREQALRHSREGRPGIWLVEADANLIFHTPYLRAVSFVPEGRDIPVHSLWHLANALFKRGQRDDPDRYLPRLDRLKVRRGSGILDDMPEAFVGLASRQMLAMPWRYWRYPLGAHRRREPRLYEVDDVAEPPLASDPGLQIKERE